MTKPKTAKAAPIPVRYAFKGGAPEGVDPQAVGEALLAMEIKPGDCHRTADVLAAAEDTKSPLHNWFTWDNTAAAEKQRLNEARSMLRNICYTFVHQEKKEVRPVYFHLRDAEGPRYVRADRVAGDEEARANAIDEVLSLLCGIRKRYSFIVELQPLFDGLINGLKNAKKKKKGDDDDKGGGKSGGKGGGKKK